MFSGGGVTVIYIVVIAVLVLVILCLVPILAFVVVISKIGKKKEHSW